MAITCSICKTAKLGLRTVEATVGNENAMLHICKACEKIKGIDKKAQSFHNELLKDIKELCSV